MTPRVALVASSTTDVTAGLLAARLSHLLGRGWDARLLCKEARWREDPAFRDQGLRQRVELAPSARGNSSPFGRPLRKFRPDLVHFHSGWAAWKGMRDDQLVRVRTAISFRDDGQDLDVPDPDLLWERADLLVFGHEAALERASARGWPRDRAAILHTPVVGLAGDRPASSKPGVLRILSAGSIIWEQGFEHSVHAVRLLLDSGIQCSYRIIGEGDHLQAVAFARHQLGLTDYVGLVAPCGDCIARELRFADVVVDPAVADTTSPALLQAAQSCGLPVVVTRGREWLLQGAGIEVPRRDPRAIADALRLLADDPDLRARMGQAGRQLPLSAPLHAHVTRLEHLYRRALGLAS